MQKKKLAKSESKSFNNMLDNLSEIMANEPQNDESFILMYNNKGKGGMAIVGNETDVSLMLSRLINESKELRKLISSALLLVSMVSEQND